MAIHYSIASKDDPIYKSGLMMSSDRVRNIAKAKKEAQEAFNASLVDIYPKNHFLLNDGDNEVWFSMENILVYGQ